MKENNKGFTLIELLAVIVILAVIALIATPLIMGTITKAKKNSAVDSAYGYMKAVEQAIGEHQVDDPTGAFDVADKTFKTKDNGATITTDSYADLEITVNYKGSQPTDGGTLTYDENGRVTDGTLNIGGYEVKITNDKATVN